MFPVLMPLDDKITISLKMVEQPNLLKNGEIKCCYSILILRKKNEKPKQLVTIANDISDISTCNDCLNNKHKYSSDPYTVCNVIKEQMASIQKQTVKQSDVEIIGQAMLVQQVILKKDGFLYLKKGVVGQKMLTIGKIHKDVLKLETKK